MGWQGPASALTGVGDGVPPATFSWPFSELGLRAMAWKRGWCDSQRALLVPRMGQVLSGKRFLPQGKLGER